MKTHDAPELRLFLNEDKNIQGECYDVFFGRPIFIIYIFFLNRAFVEPLYLILRVCFLKNLTQSEMA